MIAISTGGGLGLPSERSLWNTPRASRLPYRCPATTGVDSVCDVGSASSPRAGSVCPTDEVLDDSLLSMTLLVVKVDSSGASSLRCLPSPVILMQFKTDHVRCSRHSKQITGARNVVHVKLCISRVAYRDPFASHACPLLSGSGRLRWQGRLHSAFSWHNKIHDWLPIFRATGDDSDKVPAEPDKGLTVLVRVMRMFE